MEKELRYCPNCKKETWCDVIYAIGNEEPIEIICSSCQESISTDK